MKSHSSTDVKKLAKRSQKETLENNFHAHWALMFGNLPEPVRQHKFHPERKWRWDFAWPDQKLAVEIQGGSWVGGGHNTGAGQAKDYEKLNAATRLGWRCLLYSTPMLKDMASVVEEVAEILCNAH